MKPDAKKPERKRHEIFVDQDVEEEFFDPEKDEEFEIKQPTNESEAAESKKPLQHRGLTFF